MSERKALLIGAEEYGDGFARLNAVREDIVALSAALKLSGFEVEVCPEKVVLDAVALDKAMREFCFGGGPDDIHLLYFTGHGILVDDKDWIVPAGTKRTDAMISSTQRVSTDLSQSVATSDTGLVLFMIDACRDKQDVPTTKGGAGWGDATRTARPDSRFIRFFGCASTEVCQVLSDDPPSSLFTRALVRTLSDGRASSLRELHEQVANASAELVARNPFLQNQRPHLSYGELSAEKYGLLDKRIFDRTANAALSSVWPVFDPDKLHCLVVVSETEQLIGTDWGLADVVRDALQGNEGRRIWNSFSAACNGRKLVSGRTRDLTRAFDADSVSYASFTVTEALTSVDTLDKAARALVEADLVVFDVTAFEPGLMLLMGIRSACRRWVTICSHGAGWREGQPLEVPFNVQNLNIGSHTPGEAQAGNDFVTDRFVHRVEVGFQQLARHPHYLDLPSYDALREVGSEYAAASTISLGERVLVLCSYAPKVFSNWRFVSSRLKEWLSKANRSPAIQRIIDFGTPQLIWQSLYEQIRRSAACVVDWSGYKASVFLEMGVRLAVSEWGAVHIIDVRYLPGGDEALKLKLTQDEVLKLKLTQIEQLHRLFTPIAYQVKSGSSEALRGAAEILINQKRSNRIHRSLLPVVGEVEEAHLPVAEILRRRADSLHHPDQGQQAAPQILFHGSRAAKQDSESAALELRIAAWLYLEHRIGKAKVKDDAAMLQLYRRLGGPAADALYDVGDGESIELASYIEERLGETSKLDRARSSRKKGDALRKIGREESAREAYGTGVEALSEALQLFSSNEQEILANGPPLDQEQQSVLDELIEVYGTLGGMHQRLEQIPEAAHSYEKGATLEERFAVASTYNRLNAVKYSLLAGRTRLRELEPRIRALAELIESQLHESARRKADDQGMTVSDSGWAWADLGDCRALLGDPEGAYRAYVTFISKAEIKSPERTLAVLKKIAGQLREFDDPDVGRLESAIRIIETHLKS